MVSSQFTDGTLAWHENDGASDPTFTNHDVGDGLPFLYAHHSYDVDGDAEMDVVTASSTDDEVVWFRNDGSEARGGAV